MTRAVAVDLLVFPLDVDASERARLQTLLSQDEIERANRFVFARDRERFVVGRGRVREALGGRLSLAPRDLIFSYSENRKPSIAGLHFNLSHSGGLAALAIGEIEDALPVGSVEDVLFVTAVLDKVTAVGVGEGFLAVHDAAAGEAASAEELVDFVGSLQ